MVMYGPLMGPLTGDQDVGEGQNKRQNHSNGVDKQVQITPLTGLIEKRLQNDVESQEGLSPCKYPRRELILLSAFNAPGPL